MPIADANSAQTLRTRYHWLSLADQWGLLLAGVLALAGILLSRRPLRALGATLVAAGAIALLTFPLSGLVRGWLISGPLAAWSALVGPLFDTATAPLRPWLVPAGPIRCTPSAP